ncbi:MAG TPA: hypothetical protein VIP11_25015 [Gemmatimonadaceae bacterium]
MPPILPTLLVAGVTDRDLHDAVVGDFISTLGFGLSFFCAMLWATLIAPQVPEAYVIVAATVPAILVGGLTVLTRSREPSVPNSERRRQ